MRVGTSAKDPTPLRATPEATEATARPGGGGAERRSAALLAVLNRYGVLFALLGLVVVFSILLPQTFFTLGNFSTILSSQAILLILALGLILPLSTGEFDLSIGSVLGFAAVLMAFFSGMAGLSPLVAAAATLAVGLVVGFVNGLFVVRFGVNAFIVTLGTSTILTGLTLAVSGGQIVNLSYTALQNLSSYQVAGLPVPVYVALLAAVVLWYLFQHTPYGRHLFFVGEGREVARLAGLPVDRLRWGTFLASAFLSSIAGILAVGQLGAADPAMGASYLLPAFAAAFLGATTIQPGRFNAWGTVVAASLLITGVTGLELLGASSWAEQVFNGAALVAAVTIARFGAREAR